MSGVMVTRGLLFSKRERAARSEPPCRSIPGVGMMGQQHAVAAVQPSGGGRWAAVMSVVSNSPCADLTGILDSVLTPNE